MQGWTEGYVGGIDYIRAFYRELSPALLSFALVLRGWRPPAALDGPFAYAELGCGHGLTSAVLAASHPAARFEAMDFNPAHIAGAQRLAAEAGLGNAAFLEESFADYAVGGAKDMDMVALHGVWSWVSAENRAILVDLLRRRLKPGGLVFVSYNALPGTLAYMPLRRILVEHAADRPGELPERIEQAVGFAGKLAALNAGWFAGADEVPARLESLKRKSPNYIAHEYLNSDWTAFYHADVARELAAAKLDFAGPSVPMEQIDELSLSPDALALIREARDPAYRETLRDVLTNRGFRRDLFVKGAERLSPADRAERLRATRFALLVPPDDLPEVAITPAGRVPFPPDLHQPLAEALAGGAPRLDELLAVPALARQGEDAVLRALMMLTSLALVSPALPDEGLEERKAACDRFNAAVLERNRTSDELGTLASPVIGSGVAVSRIEALFLLAQRRGADPAAFTWERLSAEGLALSRDGARLSTEEENVAELRGRLDSFTRRRMPVLQALGVL
ncbi:class I SAM-dependent methyltransferase [Azospirillum sp. sgz302134]